MRVFIKVYWENKFLWSDHTKILKDMDLANCILIFFT